MKHQSTQEIDLGSMEIVGQLGSLCPITCRSPNSCRSRLSSHVARKGLKGEVHLGTGSVFVGIDVSKAHLDIAVRPKGDEWRVSNSDTGIEEAREPD